MICIDKLLELLDRAADGDTSCSLSLLCEEALYTIKALKSENESLAKSLNEACEIMHRRAQKEDPTR